MPLDAAESLSSGLSDAQGQEFWPLRKGSEFVSAVKTQERRYFDAMERRGLTAMFGIAWAQYYGTDPANPGDMATQTLKRTGPQLQYTRFRINEVRSFIRQQNVIALGERPAFQCLATNSDFESISQVEICDSIVQYLYKRSMGEARERSVLEADGVWGAGFGHLRWDFEGGDEVDVMQPIPPGPDGQPVLGPDGQPAQMPVKQMSGAPTVTVCYPWEVVQDPGARELNWVMVRERCSKFELAHEYPEHSDRISKSNILDEYAIANFFGYDPDQANSDDCILKHFYYPRCAAMPEGRYVGMCADEILWDLPCPVKEGVPVVELCSGKYVAAAFGYADSWDLISVQEMIDRMVSDTATNHSVFGRQILFYDKGSDFDFDMIAAGIAAFGKTPGTEPPQAVNYAKMPESVQWFIEYLHSRHQSLSGLNATARGTADKAITSGQMAALYHSIAIEFQSARQAALDGYRERMANLQLDMVRMFADAPFLVEVAGEDERNYLQEFTKDSVAGVRRVTLVTTSPMMRSQPGRLELYLQVKDLPPDQRSAAIEMITSGNVKQFTRKSRSCAMRIQWENEKLSDGIPCQVLVTDDPFKHIPEHVATLERLSTSANPSPQAVQMLQQHILQHAMQYQSLDPRLAAFLGIPPPPPIPNSPAGLLMMETGGMGQPTAGPNAPQNDNGNAQGGGSGPNQPKPKQRDSSGVALPAPAQPPPNAGLQGAAATSTG